MYKTSSILLILSFLSYSEIWAQDTLTVREVFNFKTGDIFHYQTGGVNWPIFNQIDRITILEKHYSKNEDTLFYTRSIEGYSENWVPAPDTSSHFYDVEVRFYSYTDNIHYANLDSSIFHYLFEGHFKYLDDHEGSEPIRQDTIVRLGAEYCNRIINGYYYGDFGIGDIVEVGEGLGITYIATQHEECMGCYSDLSRMIYYRKDTDSCGTPDYRTNTGVNVISSEPDVELYPNPANDRLFIRKHTALYILR